MTLAYHLGMHLTLPEISVVEPGMPLVALEKLEKPQKS